MIVPFTSKMKKACAHRIKIPAQHILKDPSYKDPITDSVALTDHIRVVDISQIGPRMGQLTDTAMVSVVDSGLAYLVGYSISSLIAICRINLPRLFPND